MKTGFRILACLLGACGLIGCEAVQQVAQEKNVAPAAVATGKRDIEKTLEGLAARVDPARAYSEAEYYTHLQGTLEKNRNLFGAAWAIPGEGDLADIYYVYVDGSAFVTRSDRGVDTADPVYNWLRKTISTGSGGWSQPYQAEDHAGNRLTLVTYSLPIRKPGGGYSAVVACDYLIRRDPPASSGTPVPAK